MHAVPSHRFESKQNAIGEKRILEKPPPHARKTLPNKSVKFVIKGRVSTYSPVGPGLPAQCTLHFHYYWLIKDQMRVTPAPPLANDY